MRLRIRNKLTFELLALSLSVLACAALAPAVSARPNIVVIQSDDQTFSQFTPEVMPKTYKLLVDHGTSFKDYMVTTGLCCPSRASLFSGQYGHNNGVLNNGNAGTGGYPALRDKGNVLPVWLQQAGYNTIHVGKFMNAYSKFVTDPAAVAPGWTDWQTLFSGEGRYFDYDLSDNGTEVHKGTANRDYVTRVLTRKALQAIHQYAPDKRPFYLQIDHRAPHIARGNRPGRCAGGTRNPEPDPKDMDEFRNAPLPKKRSFDEADMRDKPPFLSDTPLLTYRDRKLIKRHWSCALASLVGVDRSVARVFNAVKKSGELRNTVFIYISDNGQFYGEHRLQDGKVLPYDEALHEPLAIRMPKRYRDGAKRIASSGEPVANIDLAPTILSLAKGQPCPPEGACRTMDGRSLMPLLTRSGSWPQGRGLLTEFRVTRTRSYPTCEFAGIKTKSNIYVEHYAIADRGTNQCVRTFQVERYKLKDDPLELKNVCYGGLRTSCPVTPQQTDLEQRLQSLRRCAGIEGRDQRVNGRPYCE